MGRVLILLWILQSRSPSSPNSSRQITLTQAIFPKFAAFTFRMAKKIESPKLHVANGTYNSITHEFCTANKKETGDKDEFGLRGGLKQMGKALQRGMVLVMSLWDDGTARMLWLDSVYPVGASGPGVERGPCDTSSGDPSDCRSKYPSSYVTYGNIKVGTIGSTTKFPPAPPSPVPPPTPPAPGPSPSPQPPSPSSGQCCYGAAGATCATMSSCQGGFCGQSQSQCEGNCNGKWCPKEDAIIV